MQLKSYFVLMNIVLSNICSNKSLGFSQPYLKWRRRSFRTQLQCDVVND